VILSSGDVWSLTLSYFCYGYTPAIFFTWFFIYLTRVRGLDSQAASYYSMVPFIAMSLGSAAGGWIADRVCKRFGRRWGRCGVASLGLAGAAALIAAGSQVPSAALASLVLALGAGSVYISQSAYWALSADLAGSSAGSVSGFMNFGCQMGAALTAMTTPWIAAHYGWTASFLTSAAFCALGAAFWLLVDPNRSLAPQDAPAPE
jgi:ACS family glucarate transporter-like MFS transporter